jgi:hypothetical protein
VPSKKKKKKKKKIAILDKKGNVLLGNIEALLRNNCCRLKIMFHIFCMCVCVFFFLLRCPSNTTKILPYLFKSYGLQVSGH